MRGASFGVSEQRVVAEETLNLNMFPMETRAQRSEEARERLVVDLKTGRPGEHDAQLRRSLRELRLKVNISLSLYTSLSLYLYIYIYIYIYTYV